MATVVLFPSVLGVRQGVHDAATRLRGDGHDVVIADLLDGRTFDEYPPAMSYAWEEIGQGELLSRASKAVADLPDGFVVAGMSLGCVAAAHVGTTRKVSGVLMLFGAIPVSAFGDGRTWAAGVPAQTHQMMDDPWRDDEETEQAIHDVNAGGGTIDVFDYVGSGHLFTDPTLSDEYDAVATQLMWSRVLPFVRSCDER